MLRQCRFNLLGIAIKQASWPILFISLVQQSALDNWIYQHTLFKSWHHEMFRDRATGDKGPQPSIDAERTCLVCCTASDFVGVRQLQPRPWICWSPDAAVQTRRAATTLRALHQAEEVQPFRQTELEALLDRHLVAEHPKKRQATLTWTFVCPSHTGRIFSIYIHCSSNIIILS